ncbi:DUF3379 family protein [Marinicella sp. S1101]|uniref:DUF3379 family protein n=1 Tax=Marinicella marina TaxID=2996016 RepID=UPI002260F568|nr:DUF3379 family protein [Marinicella marina]MCX7552990.1 DUF3379 family protein [Marinicella marina]MDJ1139700.1 DUF3379 family protein [Marinicella marina]
MNYFEFKQILASDPYSKDPDFLAAKNNDTRCYRAYQEAMKRERTIKAALEIPVPQHNIQHIKFRQAQDKQNTLRNQFFAVAASAVLMIGAGLFFLNNNQSSELERFINEALMMEPTVYMSDEEIPHDELQPLFASINTAVDGDLGDVHFMKLCPTLNGKGARMVFMNDFNQPITVLYMPNSPIESAFDMQMDGFKGKIVALEQGSAAIIARPHESTAQIETALINTLRPIQ